MNKKKLIVSVKSTSTALNELTKRLKEAEMKKRQCNTSL